MYLAYNTYGPDANEPKQLIHRQMLNIVLMVYRAIEFANCPHLTQIVTKVLPKLNFTSNYTTTNT